MIAGKKYVGPMADIWSMGVILFALVCGYLPFEDPNTALLYKKILSGDYKAPKWISPEVKDLIRCILEVDPRKRYTMHDIRKHPWYNIVREVDIPKEIINESEDEIIRNETLKYLSTSGLDIQALLDGLASHACNSLTATYYLFEQKQRASRPKDHGSHSNKHQPYSHSHSHNGAIQTNHGVNDNGNNNNAENNSAQPHRPKSNPHPETNPNSAPYNPNNNNNNNDPLNVTQIVKPSPLFVNTNAAAANHNGALLLPTTTAGQNGPRSPSNKNTNITPYLQTPQIIQQAKLQQQHPQQPQQLQQHIHQPSSPTSGNNAANNTPSLDLYMKTGFTMPIGANNNNANNPSNNQNIPPITNNAQQLNPINKMIISKPANGPEIPQLNLKKPRLVVPPLQRGALENPTVEPLLSQTARLPTTNPILGNPPTVSGTSNAIHLNPIITPQQPQTARGVLETNHHPPNQSSNNNNQPSPLDKPVIGTAVAVNPEFPSPIEGYDLTEGNGRPATRRSRMRSRGGEVPMEERQFEPLPAEGILEMDEIPIPLDSTKILNSAQQQHHQPNSTSSKHNKEKEIINNEMQRLSVSDKPAAHVPSTNIVAKAPEGNGPSKPSNAQGSGGAGGRRGKNLVAVSQQQQQGGSEGSEGVVDVTSKPVMSNNVPIQPTPPTQNRPSNAGGGNGAAPNNPQQPSGIAPLKPVRPLPAGVAPDSSALNAVRQEAQKNKIAAQGTLRI